MFVPASVMGRRILTTGYPILYVIWGKCFFFNPLYLLFDGILKVKMRKNWTESGFLWSPVQWIGYWLKGVTIIAWIQSALGWLLSYSIGFFRWLESYKTHKAGWTPLADGCACSAVVCVYAHPIKWYGWVRMWCVSSLCLVHCTNFRLIGKLCFWVCMAWEDRRSFEFQELKIIIL